MTEAPEVTDPPAEPEELGDAGKKALVAERRRADTLEKELKALRAEAEQRANAELTELERFKKENDELRNAKSASELEAIRLRVAIEKGIPANLAARLQGADVETITADADDLVQLLGTKPGQVRADPSQGPKPTVTEQTPGQQFAAFISAARGQ